MRKLYLIILIWICCIAGFAQKKDSVVISIDTIHVHGKVVNEQGQPISGALVLSETLDKKYNFIQTRTDHEGLFKLKGISPKDRLRIRKETEAVDYKLNGSRYLLVTMVPLMKLDLNRDKNPFSIKAKRISPKEKYSYKAKDTLLYFDFDFFGHYWPATYPGGMQKFYDFINNNVNYPDKAIKNNTEGVVTIEFTIDTKGNYKDFSVIRDIGYGCAEEVLNVIKRSKKWNSAFNGNPVIQRVSLEVPFKLVD